MIATPHVDPSKGTHEIASHQAHRLHRWTQDQRLSRRCVLEHPEGNRACPGATVSQTVTEIDKLRRGGTLSGAIRLFVLDRVPFKKSGGHRGGRRQPLISAASFGGYGGTGADGSTV
jgi:hypothetical protein